MSWQVLCVGEAMGALTPDPPAPLREGPPLRLDVAGAESNVASWLAMLAGAAGPADGAPAGRAGGAPAGQPIAWRSRVGADPIGELVVRRLAAAGVDISRVETDPTRPTGICLKDPGPGGPTAVHYYRRGSAAAAMDRRMLAGMPPVRVLHLSGITAALSDSCADLLGYALTERPVPGALTSFDVNYRPALWPAGTAGPALATLANAADLVFVGRDEAETLWGTGTAEQIRKVLPGPATLVVKDGAADAWAHQAGRWYVVPAPAVPVVEPVGAGDGFAAGYLWGLLSGAEPAARLRLGHLVAGCALRVAGDLGQPPPVEAVQAALRAGGEDG